MKTNKILPLLLLLVLTICINNIYAQSSFKAVYRHTERYDDHTVRDKEFTLYYKNGISKYDFIAPKNKVIEGNYIYSTFAEHTEYYYDANNNICHQFKQLPYKKTPIVAEWQNDIKWNITDETKKIGKYTVQKAIKIDTLVMKINSEPIISIRETNIWFTTEIPVGVGPKDFVGLPGLVIKVESDPVGFIVSKDVTELQSIVLEEVKDIVINKNGIPVTKKQMIKPHIIKRRWLRKQRRAFKKKNK